MVPPCSGCGWHTSAAWVAWGGPEFKIASSLPAGPGRNRLLISPATDELFSEVGPAGNEVEVVFLCELQQRCRRRSLSRHAPFIAGLEALGSGNCFESRD